MDLVRLVVGELLAGSKSVPPLARLAHLDARDEIRVLRSWRRVYQGASSFDDELSLLDARGVPAELATASFSALDSLAAELDYASTLVALVPTLQPSPVIERFTNAYSADAWLGRYRLLVMPRVAVAWLESRGRPVRLIGVLEDGEGAELARDVAALGGDGGAFDDPVAALAALPAL